jgi:hypothetical protein
VSTASTITCLDEKILQIQDSKLAETEAIMKGEDQAEQLKKKMYELMTQ